MATGKLLNEIVFVAAFALPGGVLVGLAFMAAFVLVGRALLMVRRIQALHAIRADGNTQARRPTTPGAAAVPE
jgi:hypothetical protein